MQEQPATTMTTTTLTVTDIDNAANYPNMKNPLLDKWSTPYETPPFHLIEVSHFKPAAEEAIKAALAGVEAIAENRGKPTFENTVGTLERTGEKLSRISSLLFSLNSAETSDELQNAAQEISPMLVRFSNDVTMNGKLFERIHALYESRGESGLDTEQMMLLEKVHRNFILGGAGLDPEHRKRFREISEQLAELTLRFEANVLHQTNSFRLHITDERDLAGLPPDIVAMASAEAEKIEKTGWVFTLNQPSYVPFMQFAANRDLREQMFRAYRSRCFHGDEKDNSGLVLRIVNLRLEKAKLLGFQSYAHMVLTDRMADSPDKVISFLDRLHKASRDAALRDYENLKSFAIEQGLKYPLERWDWPYYSEKLKKARYNIDDEILKPYFSLETVREAIFSLASSLFGLQFVQNTDIPVYHREVSAWEVHDGDGKILAILYLDHHPRKGKHGGAWMTSFRNQRSENGKRIIPHVSIVMNFTRPGPAKPSLLTFNELTTYLHEFGHALHGILSDCTYESLAGTNVAHDFVELPSQFMENWAYEKEWLDMWAVHYETGEKLPGELIEKIRETAVFNEGYACNRQLGFGFLDMAWHTVSEPVSKSVDEFERETMTATEILRPVRGTNMSCSFTHLFGGEYAAGYYGYKWAEVLDADAFYFFRESGLFNKTIACSFRKNILERGGSGKPMDLYIRFRGKEPSIEPFLDRSGLKK